MNISNRQLKMFIVLAKELNFTHAAKKLYVSQPAISMQMKQLESELGVSLFEQLGKKIFLTTAGQEVLHYAENVLHELDELNYTINEIRGVKRGYLRIFVANSLSNLAAKIIQKFLLNYPNVSISLEVGNRSQQIEKLENNAVDLTIMGKPPESGKYASELIAKTEILAVVAADHKLAYKKKISLKDLKTERYIYGEIGSSCRVAMDNKFIGDYFNNLHIEANNNEMVKQCVKAGIGVGLLPKINIESELENNTIVSLELEGFPIYGDINLVYLKDKKMSAVAEKFKQIALGLIA